MGKGVSLETAEEADLAGREIRVPQIDYQNNAALVAIVPYLVRE